MKATKHEVIGTITAIPRSWWATGRSAWRKIFPRAFPGSEQYWDARYRSGGTSGTGSYGELAAFKAEVLNGFVREMNVGTVIEYGCGDGNQLRQAEYPQYLGFDVSPQAIKTCVATFRKDRTKRFKLMKEYRGEQAELTLSLDVIYHLVEDAVFESYMKRLFSSAERYVVIYSSDTADAPVGCQSHERHRKFSTWVDECAPEWKRIRHLPNRYPFDSTTGEGSLADFFFYSKSVRTGV